jgi:hypothetical protein
MNKKVTCCFFFYDYKDYDVYINARTFYRLAGFTLISTVNVEKCDLIVVFRGIPGRNYPEYTGVVHYYDYVCEHSLDIQDYFPNAASIYVVTCRNTSIYNTQAQITRVYGYLPVIPLIWSSNVLFPHKSSLPVHVSNFKPILGDQYQNELISLIKSRQVQIFGSKWDRIQVNALPLSYLAANKKLSDSFLCYGLMYPYQRGQSLSGRMWQGPIHGCFVISELNTNILSCPGVLEMESFLTGPLLTLNINMSKQLAIEARLFWVDKTETLAADLGLSLQEKNLIIEVAYARISLHLQHYSFFLKSLSSTASNRIIRASKAFFRYIYRF